MSRPLLHEKSVAMRENPRGPDVCVCIAPYRDATDRRESLRRELAAMPDASPEMVADLQLEIACYVDEGFYVCGERMTAEDYLCDGCRTSDGCRGWRQRLGHDARSHAPAELADA